MRSIDLNEVKRIELNILKYIDNVCKESNLRYSLCGGTLIGAIRHNGFIPWDDDIDIMMPRPDYDQMIEIINGEDNRYYAFNETDSNYYYNFSKVVDTNTVLFEKGYTEIDGMGVFVDVFPVDSFPDDITLKKAKEIHKIRKLINYYAIERIEFGINIIKWIKNKYYYHLSRKNSLYDLQEKYLQVVKKEPYGSTEKVFLTGAYEILPLPLEMFEEYTEVKFEDEWFSSIKHYDEYLTKVFGNYMKLPPKKDQMTIHNIEAYWKSNDRQLTK